MTSPTGPNPSLLKPEYASLSFRPAPPDVNLPNYSLAFLGGDSQLHPLIGHQTVGSQSMGNQNMGNYSEIADEEGIQASLSLSVRCLNRYLSEEINRNNAASRLCRDLRHQLAKLQKDLVASDTILARKNQELEVAQQELSRLGKLIEAARSPTSLQQDEVYHDFSSPGGSSDATMVAAPKRKVGYSIPKSTATISTISTSLTST